MKPACILIGLALVGSATSPAWAAEEAAPEPPAIVWQEWGETIFERARQEQKGVLLTVVHPWCRPCINADREVYSDPAVRLAVDRLWIPVRVDAYDRPDLDARYRFAMSVLGRGEGGYPLTAFLFPSGEAMWVDTFIPAEDRERPGMRSLLRNMDHFWKNRFPEAQGNARAVQAIFDNADKQRREGRVDAALFDAVVDHVLSRIDSGSGGIGPAPRRQNPMAAELLRIAAIRRSDPALAGKARSALLGAVRGALFDRIDGGFHRATRTEDWSVPWFGKELAVNAVYLQALSGEVLVSGDAELAAAASRTVDFVLGRLRAPGGGFFTAELPARPGEDEADHFAWLAEEVGAALDEPSRAWAEALFGYSVKGELELGLPARFTLKSRPDAVAAIASAGLDPGESETRRARIVEALSGLRNARGRPPVVERRYLDSTAMACSALFAAAAALDRPDAADAALDALDPMRDRSSLRKGIPHSLDEPAGSPLLMVDHAWLGHALLDAHEYTGDHRWLDAASAVAGMLVEVFGDQDGAFFDVVDQPKAAGYVRLRRKIFHDSATPSPIVVAGRFLDRLGRHTGDESLIERGRASLEWVAGRIPTPDLAATTLATAADALLEGPVIVRIGEGRDSTKALRLAALRLGEPSRIVVTARGDRGSAARAELCVKERCLSGLSSAEGLSDALRELRLPGGGAAGTEPGDGDSR